MYFCSKQRVYSSVGREAVLQRHFEWLEIKLDGSMKGDPVVEIVQCLEGKRYLDGFKSNCIFRGCAGRIGKV